MAKITPQSRLRKWRGARSLREAAELIGTDHGHLARLESGGRLPSYSLAAALESLGAGPADAWHAYRLAAAKERAR